LTNLRVDPDLISDTKDELTDSNFVVYPNPTTTELTVAFTQRQSGKLRLINLQGQLLLQQDFRDTKQLDLNVGHLAEGLYYIQVTDDQHHTTTESFVKSSY